MVKVLWETEEDMKNNMKEGIKNGRQAFEWGILHPRQNPMEAAIIAINAGIWEKNFKAGIEKWVKKLSKVTIEEWKAAAKAAATSYADRAAGIGSENWGKYYAKALPVIESATIEFVKSTKTREDYIKFFENMGKLRGI